MNCTHNLTFMPFGPQLLHQKELIQVKKRNSKEKGVHSSEAYAGLIKINPSMWKEPWLKVFLN